MEMKLETFQRPARPEIHKLKITCTLEHALEEACKDIRFSSRKKGSKLINLALGNEYQSLATYKAGATSDLLFIVHLFIEPNLEDLKFLLHELAFLKLY